MKKAIGSIILAALVLMSFSFIENEKQIVCGSWAATVFFKGGVRKSGVDTLEIKRNGRFTLKKYSIESFPGLYMGRWKIANDSLLLLADTGGMMQFDEKGKPMAEKLKEKKNIKLSIVIHSRDEANLMIENYSFSRITPTN